MDDSPSDVMTEVGFLGPKADNMVGGINPNPNDPAGPGTFQITRPELFRAFGGVVANLAAMSDADKAEFAANSDKFNQYFRDQLVTQYQVAQSDLTLWLDFFVLVAHFQPHEALRTSGQPKTELHMVIPDASPDPNATGPVSVIDPDQHALELGFRVLGGCFH